jgi:hypothetical protein
MIKDVITREKLGLILPHIPALRPNLAAARFTTFDQQGGTQLAALMNLVRNLTR